jgi:tetratricopeptide (TPR) repeat protein
MFVIIAVLIICLYFLTGILYAKNNKFDLKSFTSLGYATSFLVVMILFYSPLKSLITRTAKDATSIRIGKAEIELSLPIVAISHIKNEIVSDAILSEKKIMRDRTNNPEVLKQLLYLNKFDIDRMKCKYNNSKIRGEPLKELLLKINCYEEFNTKLSEIILPDVNNKNFKIALDNYEKLNNEWKYDVNAYVPHNQTVYGLLCAANGLYKKSSMTFKNALEVFPNDISLLHYCGGLCMNDGDLIGSIHNTKRAMAIMTNEYDEFIEEHNNTSNIISDMILSKENREEIISIVNFAKSLQFKSVSNPSDYEDFINRAIAYWKNRLAYLLSLARLDEMSARKFASDLNEFIQENEKNEYANYLDTIGLVNLVFAKRIDQILEAKKQFYEAKRISIKSKSPDNIIIDRIDSHIKLVNNVLKN